MTAAQNRQKFPVAEFIDPAKRIFNAKILYLENDRGESAGKLEELKMGENLLLTVKRGEL